MNGGLNYRKMDQVRLAKLKKIGLKHVLLMISLYQNQFNEGHDFLHVHLASANNSHDRVMV